MSSTTSDPVGASSELEFAPKLKQSAGDTQRTSVPIQHSSSKPRSHALPHSRKVEKSQREELEDPSEPSLSQAMQTMMTKDQEQLRTQWLDMIGTLAWDRYSATEATVLEELKSKIFGNLELNRIANGWSKDDKRYEEQLMRTRKMWLTQMKNKLDEWRESRFKKSSSSRVAQNIASRVWTPIVDSDDLEMDNRIVDVSDPSAGPDAHPVEPRSDLRYNRRERIIYYYKNKTDYDKLLGTWRPLGADPLLSVYRNDPITYRERWLHQRGPKNIENAPLLPIKVLDRIIESSGTTTPYIPSCDALKDKMIGVNKMSCRENYIRPLGARIVPVTWRQPYHTLVGTAEPLEWDSGRYIPKAYEPLLRAQPKPIRSLTPTVLAEPPQHWFHGPPEPKSYDAGCYIPKDFQCRLKGQATSN